MVTFNQFPFLIGQMVQVIMPKTAKSRQKSLIRLVHFTYFKESGTNCSQLICSTL